MDKIKGALRRTFLAGLVVAVPILLTIFALYWLFRIMDGFFSPILHQIIGREIPGLGILTEIVVIFLAGIVATNVLGSRILTYLQNSLMRIPVVKNIYPTIRQIVEAFQPSSGSSFEKVVLVEYPKNGMLTFGFLTGEISEARTSNTQRFYSVYIPTNNLYLGQVGLFKAEEVIITSFSIEEGLKIILSGGTACPPTFQRPTP